MKKIIFILLLTFVIFKSNAAKTFDLKNTLPLIQNNQKSLFYKASNKVKIFPRISIQLSCCTVTFSSAYSEIIVAQASIGGSMWVYGFLQSLESLACSGNSTPLVA